MDRYVIVKHKDTKVVYNDGLPHAVAILWPWDKELHPDYEVIGLLSPVSAAHERQLRGLAIHHSDEGGHPVIPADLCERFDKLERVSAGRKADLARIFDRLDVLEKEPWMPEDPGHHEDCPMRQNADRNCNCASLYGEVYGRGSMPEAAKVEQPEHGGLLFWTCKVGPIAIVPAGGDGPLRQSVLVTFRDMFGGPPSLCESDWGEEEQKYGRSPMEAVDQMATLKRTWDEISPAEQIRFLAWTCSEEAGAPTRLRCPTSRLRPVTEAAAPDPLEDPFSHETAVDLVERFKDKDGGALAERARTRDAIFKVTQLLNRGDTREALESLTALYESLPEE